MHHSTLLQNSAHSVRLALRPRALQTDMAQLVGHHLLASLVVAEVALDGFLVHFLDEAYDLSVLCHRGDGLRRTIFGPTEIEEAVTVSGICVRLAVGFFVGEGRGSGIEGGPEGEGAVVRKGKLHFGLY